MTTHTSAAGDPVRRGFVAGLHRAAVVTAVVWAVAAVVALVGMPPRPAEQAPESRPSRS